MATESLVPPSPAKDQSQINFQVSLAAFIALLIIGYHYQ
jgi:hypothetical protein